MQNLSTSEAKRREEKAPGENGGFLLQQSAIDSHPLEFGIFLIASICYFPCLLAMEGSGVAKHPLESKYGLSSDELLDAISARFRLQVAVEGAVSEFHMEKHILNLVGSVIEQCENHDLDGQPDFSIWLPGRPEPLLVECKNVRESSRKGGEGYRKDGKIIAYKAETQKTRAATGDPTSRFYDFDHFDVLGVCLGKKTGKWTDFLYARTVDLARHTKHPHKLAVFQRVPLPDAENLQPWYSDMGVLLTHFGDPPWQ